MAKQVTIKDIAISAGVSTGTVDRIIHNRGKVSASARAAVEKVLSEIDYNYNLHTSAISLKKQYKLVITKPFSQDGEYWGYMQKGFDKALREFRDIDITCTYVPYNQFDAYSCIEAFKHITETQPDAVVIGPTFIDETRALCAKLDEQGIPYIFVDSTIEGTNPHTFFSTDKYACGRVLARMLLSDMGYKGDIAVFDSVRLGNRQNTNSIERTKGFIDYVNDARRNGMIAEDTAIVNASFSATSSEGNVEALRSLLEKNPDIKGIAVLNSRGYVLADTLEQSGISGISIVAFDLTDNNIKFLKKGFISALICQNPDMQGYLAIEAVLKHLLYNKPGTSDNQKIPIDIVVKENVEYFEQSAHSRP